MIPGPVSTHQQTDPPGPRFSWHEVLQRLRIAACGLGALALTATTSVAIDIPLPGERTVSVHGYYKNFFAGIHSNVSLLDDGVSDLNRARLMLHSEIFEDWELSVHYETIAEIHPVLGGGGFFGTMNRPGLTELNWSIDRSDDLNWTHELDRLQVRGRLDWGDVTIGRQAIGWGVGLIWAPLDLLVGFSPVLIDREYRIGVDAVRTLIPLGSFTEIEAVYAAYETSFDQHVAAFRWRTTFPELDTDVGIIAGKFFDDAVVGALVATEVAGAGVHSSMSITHHYGDDTGPRDYVRLVAGIDYRFPYEILGLVEYYFNGWGASESSRYLSRLTSDRLQRGEVFNVGRHYLGFTLDWEAHPLVHLAGRGQANLTDPSAQIGPAMTISVSDEAQIEAGAFFSLGSTLDGIDLASEFGPQPHFFYTAAKIYF